MGTSSTGHRGHASGRAGATLSAEQPSTPFYDAPGPWTCPLSSCPPTTEYRLPGTFPGSHGYSDSVPNASDSMVVEPGSPLL